MEKLECGCIVLSGHKLTDKDCKVCTRPKSLFYLCKRKIQQFPEIEKELFHYHFEIDYEFAYEKIIKRILHDVNTPYLKNNKSFERYFRKLVKEHIYVCASHASGCDNAREMLSQTQCMLEKIKHFKKIYGIVADTFYDLCFLEYELKFLLKE